MRFAIVGLLTVISHCSVQRTVECFEQLPQRHDLDPRLDAVFLS
jgi:hypothetical protein